MDVSLLEPYAPYAIGAVVIWIGFKVIRSIFSKGGASEYTTERTCDGCGWTGRVGQYSGTCPKCGASIA